MLSPVVSMYGTPGQVAQVMAVAHRNHLPNISPTQHFGQHTKLHQHVKGNPIFDYSTRPMSDINTVDSSTSKNQPEHSWEQYAYLPGNYKICSLNFCNFRKTKRINLNIPCKMFIVYFASV